MTFPSRKLTASCFVFLVFIPLFFTKGKPLSDHIGNTRLHNLVEDLMDDYTKLEKKEKSKLLKSLVMEVKAKSGRFISKDSGIWREVKDEVATTKLSHLFRARRAVMKVKTKDRTPINTQSEKTSSVSIANSSREILSSNKRGRAGLNLQENNL